MVEKIDEAQFDERFRPVKNHINPNASWNGCLYETFGEELAHVEQLHKEAPGRVWTVVDAGCDLPVVISGFHFVNRIGYLVTEVAADREIEVEVV